MSARVFIWVQHLLGFGHFARARVVAEALRDAGYQVTLVSGGATPAEAVPAGLNFVRLPPARAKDELFDELVDADGRLVDQRWHEGRRDALLAAFRAAKPDLLITETYPFGRRLLEFELLALLAEAKAATPRPLIVASVRDVLQRPRKDARALGMVERARADYDGIIVHGDPSVVRLEESFAEVVPIAARVRYTGYICADIRPFDGARREVLVSAGGGAAGGGLMAAALRARELSGLRDAPWTFVTGPLTEALPAREGVTIVRSLPDFRARLAAAAVSVSQAGYNTMIETVKVRTPAVVVPFETEREKEQAMRAAVFARRGLVRMVAAGALDAAVLARAIDETAGTVPPVAAVDFDGRAGVVRVVRELLGR